MKDVVPKLKFKGHAVVINAPQHLKAQFSDCGCTISEHLKSLSNNTLIFINNRNEFVEFLNKELKYVEPDSVLWFAYPKQTSKINTDINRDSIRGMGEGFGLATVTAISIDETWSALRFRPIDKVGK